MELINKVTVGSGGAANIDFTSIPSTYTDLCVLVSGRSTHNNEGDYLLVNFNNSSSNITSRTLGAFGPSSTFSGNETLLINILPASLATANTFGNNQIYVQNYASSNNKSLSIEGGFENNSSSSWFLFMTAGLWSNSSAITSVKLFLLDGSFVQNTTAYLYGVTSVTSSAKATGGTITSDGAYFYHTFTSSGTFTPTGTLSCDYLVVGGGGGGGGGTSTDYGSGGAGGTCRTGSNFNVSSAATVTIGSGGSASGNGTSSVFSSITATAGNGSGQTSKTGGANADFSGDTGAGNGGGGGAGSGASASSSNGGAGATSLITGTSVNYGGGGSGTGSGGATVPGGAGGGGFGNIPGANGTANTGGGGGGSQLNANTNGGSGLVIIRYAV